MPNLRFDKGRGGYQQGKMVENPHLKGDLGGWGDRALVMQGLFCLYQVFICPAIK